MTSQWRWGVRLGWLAIAVLSIAEMLETLSNRDHPIQFFNNQFLSVGFFLVVSWFALMSFGVRGRVLWFLKMFFFAVIFWLVVRSIGFEITHYYGLTPDQVISGFVVAIGTGFAGWWLLASPPQWLKRLSPLNRVIIRLVCWEILLIIWLNYNYISVFNDLPRPLLKHIVFSLPCLLVLTALRRSKASQHSSTWTNILAIGWLLVSVVVLRAWIWVIWEIMQENFAGRLFHLPNGVNTGVISTVLLLVNFVGLPVVLVWLRSRDRGQPSRQIQLLK